MNQKRPQYGGGIGGGSAQARSGIGRGSKIGAGAGVASKSLGSAYTN